MGYGAFWYKGRMARAHRVSWVLHNGGIPEGIEVMHKCDVPACVRPDHLMLGTQADNVADMVAKGRDGKSPLHGEQTPWSKLTELDVQAIRLRLALKERHYIIARDYGVARTTITAISVGKNWKHLKEPD